MSNETAIQWCDTTVNPTMGCDGCELYPGIPQIVTALNGAVNAHASISAHIASVVAKQVEHGPQWLKLHLKQVAETISSCCAASSPGLNAKQLKKDIIERVSPLYRCYAATLHRFACSKTPKPGWAFPFEKPVMVPGRTSTVASLPPRTADEAMGKPWLEGTPRLIFVSDMGDALSAGISFETLDKEIIEPAVSVEGRRHLWLWLTKRPGRMAQFSRWLAEQGKCWPENIVAMTSVTSSKTVNRIDKLLKVPAKYRGISVEPLWEDVTLPLGGISWVIVGGESGKYARPFHVEWANSISGQCDAAGAAFFLKQLGANPFLDGKPLNLVDSHGGNWSEWPDELRRRALPAAWRSPDAMPPQKDQSASCAELGSFQTARGMNYNITENPDRKTLAEAEKQLIDAAKIHGEAGKTCLATLLALSEKLAAFKATYSALPEDEQPHGGWRKFVPANAKRLGLKFKTARMADNYIALGCDAKTLGDEAVRQKLDGCTSYREAREKLMRLSGKSDAAKTIKADPFDAKLQRLIKQLDKTEKAAPTESKSIIALLSSILQRLLIVDAKAEKSEKLPTLAELMVPESWLSELDTAWANGGPSAFDKALSTLVSACCDDTATDAPPALKFGPRAQELGDEINRMLSAKEFSDVLRNAYRATKESGATKAKVAALQAPGTAAKIMGRSAPRGSRKDNGANTMELPLGFAWHSKDA